MCRSTSVAVWVGFLALFGIATDDGVVQAGKRRIRPCLMTTAATVLALLPILTSTGRGSDVMVPMAIPSFGGMTVVLVTVFVVSTLFCAVEERKARWASKDESDAVPA